MKNYKAKLLDISTFIFDYDGVMTNGSVWHLDSGEQIRRGNVKDGYALHHAIKNDFRIAVISGGTCKTIKGRLETLGLKDIFIGVGNKIKVFNEYIERHNLSEEEILYMGDDIPDYEILKRVGLASCPMDAADDIAKICHYISPYNGGEGCVRDILEQALKVQGKWMNDNAFYW